MNLDPRSDYTKGNQVFVHGTAILNTPDVRKYTKNHCEEEFEENQTIIYPNENCIVIDGEFDSNQANPFSTVIAFRLPPLYFQKETDIMGLEFG